MRQPRRRDDGIYDVNMTPLIDVSLVLVVILLVATPLAFQSGIAVRKAASTGRHGADVAPTERIEVSVISPDSVQVNRQVVRRAAFAATLTPLVEASANKVVVVRCSDNVSHGTFVSVLDEAKQAGAAQIALVGQ